MITLYGAAASGSVAVEAAMTLLGIRYRLVEGATWIDEEARQRVGTTNPMRQVPTLILPSGDVMTESAAILVWLADSHPDAGLAPAPADARRGQFLRWMTYVATAIYALHWIKPDPARIGAPPDLHVRVVDAVHDRIAECWAIMDGQINPGRYLLGERLTVLDLYVAVVSRFGPWRQRFYAAAPAMAQVVRRVDADPRLADFWKRRFPFAAGWEGD
ncbi:GST-like protein [Stella humosa]|uniref:GST-like protein n=1 Tax=Stella humosa TaxID=94 RepID=A0A3N1LHA3_9PROT|nr:glutathione S-transferase family protein [Stella humosa]ROP90630.1 GST-like protein [Stella humosa]BBK29473.1 glutathione S-transferase [Stella humosa]